MDYLDQIKFQFYPANIHKTVPLGEVSIREMIRAIKNPNENIKDLFVQIKEASALGNLALKSSLKKQLYYFTPCVMSDGLGRAYSNIKYFTSCVQLDFDGIPNAKEFRDWFFETYKSTIFAGISPSGFGCKMLVRIPKVQSVDEFKEYFCGLAYHLECFKGFDVAPFNPILPLFLFHDPELRYRENPNVASVRGFKINAFKKFEGDIEVLEDVEGWKKQRVIDIYTRGIGNIVDAGHTQVVAFSTMLGGFCSAGYLSEDEAEVLIEDCITDNEYLSKGTNSYIKTGKELLRRGMSSPLYLKEDE